MSPTTTEQILKLWWPENFWKIFCNRQKIYTAQDTWSLKVPLLLKLRFFMKQNYQKSWAGKIWPKCACASSRTKSRISTALGDLYYPCCCCCYYPPRSRGLSSRTRGASHLVWQRLRLASSELNH